MDEVGVTALSENLFQARMRQASSKRTLLTARREYERIRAEAYLRFTEPRMHYKATAQVTIDPLVMQAKSQLDNAIVQYMVAKAGSERVLTVIEISLRNSRAGSNSRRAA